MADDRVFLQCVDCRDHHLLSRYRSGGDFYEIGDRDGDRSRTTLSEFLEEHWKRCHHGFGRTLERGLEGATFAGAFRLAIESTLAAPWPTHHVDERAPKSRALCGADGPEVWYSIETPTCPECLAELERHRREASHAK